mgnify:CR=1 FL=1
MTENGFRVEADLLGKRSIPSEAYYGVHTLRAKENFDISGRTIASLPFLVMALAAVKEAAADANCELGLLPRPLRDAIAAACVEIREGRLHDQFVVDIIQGGAGNLVTDHSELLLEATCAGLGIAEFEIWLVRDLLASGRLEAVLPRYRLQNRLTGEYIYIAYLANRRSSAKLRVLKDFLLEHLAHIGELSALELTKIRGAGV